MSIRLQNIAGTEFVAVEHAGKRRTLTLPDALDFFRDGALQADARALEAEREAVELSGRLDAEIVSGKPTSTLRDELAGIRQRHAQATADAAEHRANMDELHRIILAEAAASLVATAEADITEVVDEHPVPLQESAEIIASIKATLNALEASIAGHDRQEQPEAAAA